VTVSSWGSVDIELIVWDPSVYPRSRWNTATVERYAEAMRAGDEFPPLVLEQGTNRLLDGKHRQLAYGKAGINGIPVEWHAVPDGIPVKLYAASLSARHGDRLEVADLTRVTREVYTENPDFKQKDVARLLGITESRVSDFVSDLLAKRREERRAKALRLARLGWSQIEIAERLGVSQKTISDDVSKNFQSELFTSGHKSEEIALRLGMPVQLVHAIQLDQAEDAERFARLGINIQPYDVWNFQTCHDLMGDAHPGRIPGELVCHTLYFFTKQGDLVVDPMAGSGTTLDACLLMGRKARGYDIDLHHERIDVEQHDLSTGWPKTVTKAALVFWDPPYFHKVDDGYVDGSVSRLTATDYLCFFEERLTELRDLVKPDCRLAFLMADWDGEHGETEADRVGIFIWDYADVLRRAGWQLKRHIQVPMPTQLVHPDIVNKFRESRRLARLERYLLIAEPEAT